VHEVGYIAESAPAHPGTDEGALAAEPDTAKQDRLVGACAFTGNATRGNDAGQRGLRSSGGWRAVKISIYFA
jgi:hypothetical protein